MNEYNDLVSLLGNRVSNVGNAPNATPEEMQARYQEVNDLQAQKDVFDAAISAGYKLTKDATYQGAVDYLKSQGTYDQIFASSGTLNKAKAKGYTGNDIGGAVAYLDSFNAAATQAQQAGFTVNPNTTYADIEAFAQANQAAFNATANNGQNGRATAGVNAASDVGVPTPTLVADAPVARRSTVQKQELASSINVSNEPQYTQDSMGIVYDSGGNIVTDKRELQQFFSTQANNNSNPTSTPIPSSNNPSLNVSNVPTSTYTGPSIVDYLNSVGQPSDFNSRSVLAKQYGIQNYTGTADQNTQLLGALRSRSTTPTGTQNINQPTVQNADISNEETFDESTPGGFISSQLEEQYDIIADAKKFLSNPLKSFEDIYKDAYRSIGVSSVKKEIDKISKELQAFDDKVADDIQNINDNPWYSEGVRVAKIRSLEEKNEMKRGNLLARLQIQQNLYEEGRTEARFVAQQIASEYNRSIDFAQDLYLNALNRVEALEDSRLELLTSDNSDRYESYANGAVFDREEGSWVISPPPGGVESVVDVRNRNEALTEYLGQVPTYTTRKAALDDLYRYESTIKSQIGESGYQQLLQEVDRLFPPTTTNTSINKIGSQSTLSTFYNRLFTL